MPELRTRAHEIGRPCEQIGQVVAARIHEPAAEFASAIAVLVERGRARIGPAKTGFWRAWRGCAGLAAALRLVIRPLTLNDWRRTMAKDGNKMGTNTLLAHSGNNPRDYFGFVNPPVVHASTVLYAD